MIGDGFKIGNGGCLLLFDDLTGETAPQFHFFCFWQSCDALLCDLASWWLTYFPSGMILMDEFFFKAGATTRLVLVGSATVGFQ